MEPARRRPLLWLGLGVATALAVVAGLVIDHRLGPKHLLTVTPGVLYRSGQLTPEQLADVITRHGIRTVVNLRSENERGRGDWYRREAAVVESRGARLVDLPMNAGFPPRDAQLEGWLGLIDDPAAQPVLVHCEHGLVRTGIMVAIYDIERLGLGADEALARFERFGQTLPETLQRRIETYFAGYVPRRPAG